MSAKDHLSDKQFDGVSVGEPDALDGPLGSFGDPGATGPGFGYGIMGWADAL